MCIIAYAPQGHKTISDETIRVMFDHNPDGAGFMLKMRNGKVDWHKGFMECNEFIRAVRNMPENAEIALHMRIATDGGIIPANTHPFPVSPNISDMRALDGVGDTVMMHNGIIPYCKPGGGLKADRSDSMVFAQKVLYPLRDKLGNFDVQRTLEEAIYHSRVLIMRKGSTIRLGDWETDKNGVWYSNHSYVEYPRFPIGRLTNSVGKNITKKIKQAKEKTAFYINGVPIDEDGFEIGDYAFEECY